MLVSPSSNAFYRIPKSIHQIVFSSRTNERKSKRNFIRRAIDDMSGPVFKVLRQKEDIVVLCRTETDVWYEQSRTDIKTNRAKHPYARNMIDSSDLSANSDVKVSVLILGCGGGSIPHELVHHFPNVSVTVVDSSVEAIQTARSIIGIKGQDIRYVLGDAYEFVRRPHRESHFDIILNDVFDLQTGKIPKWTTCPEWLHYVKLALRPTGMYMQNIIAKSFEEHLSELESSFDSVVAVPGEISPDGTRNIVYMCQNDRRENEVVIKK